MRKLTSECVSRLSSTCKICKNSCKNLQNVHKLADESAILFLYDDGKDKTNGVRWIGGFVEIYLRMYNVMQKNKTEEYVDFDGYISRFGDDNKWAYYNGPNQFYAAIVEKHF